jgi:hypothetical protein
MAESTRSKTPGWIVFASIMMFGLGGFALLAAIADFTNSSWMAENSILGDRLDVAWYGFLDLILGLTALYAGFAILRGTRAGYWWGIILSTLSTLRWFLLMPGAPIWAVTMVAIWVLVAYGLATNQEYFEPGATRWAGEAMAEQERARDQWR